MSSRWVEMRMQVAALRALARELGWGRAIRLGLAAESRPDPFAALPPPEDDKDQRSRDQIRPALRLYAELKQALGPDEALRVTKTALIPPTLTFLAHAVGRVDIEEYRGLPPEGRRRWAQWLMRPFPNAETELLEASEDRFVQRVTRCRFVELCAAAGVPELAPAFCAGDLVYFQRGGLDLERPSTLAGGGPCCEFRFSVARDER